MTVPKIPTYEQQFSPSGMGPQAQATARPIVDPINLSGIEQGINSVARGAEAWAERGWRMDEAKEDLEVQKKASDYALAAQNKLQELEVSMPPGGDGLRESYTKFLDDQRDELMKQSMTPRAQMKLQAHLLGVQQQSISSAMNVQAAESRRYSGQLHDDLNKNNADLIASWRGVIPQELDALYNNSVLANDRGADSLATTPEGRQAARELGNKMLSEAYAAQRINGDPAEFKAALEVPAGEVPSPDVRELLARSKAEQIDRWKVMADHSIKAKEVIAQHAVRMANIQAKTASDNQYFDAENMVRALNTDHPENEAQNNAEFLKSVYGIISQSKTISAQRSNLYLKKATAYIKGEDTELHKELISDAMHQLDSGTIKPEDMEKDLPDLIEQTNMSGQTHSAFLARIKAIKAERADMPGQQTKFQRQRDLLDEAYRAREYDSEKAAEWHIRTPTEYTKVSEKDKTKYKKEHPSKDQPWYIQSANDIDQLKEFYRTHSPEQGDAEFNRRISIIQGQNLLNKKALGLSPSGVPQFPLVSP